MKKSYLLITFAILFLILMIIIFTYKQNPTTTQDYPVPSLTDTIAEPTSPIVTTPTEVKPQAPTTTPTKQPPPPKAPEVTKTRETLLGSNFEIAINQTTTLSESLTITFLAVTGDSRCGTGAQCVWAGNATIELELIEDTKSLGTIQLVTDQVPPTTNLRGYIIELIKLAPYPDIDQPHNQDDYVATLSVSKE